MQIYFDDQFTEERREFLTKLVKFAAKILIGTNDPNITITFESLPTKKVHALCEWEDRPVLPKEFRITISRKLDEAQMALAIFHELVHVKQMYKGELKYRGIRAFWNGKEYDGNTNYWDLPWEVEAYAKQEEIGWKFLKKLESMHD